MANCLLPQGSYNSTAIEIINFFIKKGLSPNQAFGICANVFQESSYDPQARNKDSGAYGLFQWLGSREQDLINFCNKNGISKTLVKSQLAFCWHENDKNPTTGVRVWDYYMSHKNMTAMDSLIYWEQYWERCGNATSGCHRKNRIEELNRLVNLYNKNGMTDCSIDVGEAGGLEDDTCSPTTLAGEEQATNQPDNSGQRYTMEDTYSPAGNGVMNTKPVLFGGKWAYKMSPYFAKNGEYYAYTVWGGMVSPDSATILGSMNSKVISSKNVIDHIKTYLLNANNRPSHIVLTLDSPVIKYKKKGAQKPDIINGMKSAFIKAIANINASFSTRIYLPLRIDSWDNTFTVNGVDCTYEDFNTALKQAANCFWNVRVIETPEFDKGNKRPTNGILPESVWGKYSKEVKTIASNMK